MKNVSGFVVKEIYFLKLLLIALECNAASDATAVTIDYC